MRSIREILSSSSISDAELSYHALAFVELTVIRFTDDRTDQRWFMRQHEELGAVRALCDGGQPVRPDEVKAVVRQLFGADASVLWID